MPYTNLLIQSFLQFTSSSGVVGNGRAERRRRWCNWEGVIFSAGAEDGEDGRRLRTDQVGFSRIEAAVECVMLRRRATRQDVQIVMAQKQLQSAGGGFSFFGGREEKYQEAADLFTQAANAFKMQQQNLEAGKAFEQAAQVQTDKLKEPDDAANTLVDAFKAYRKDDPQAAARCLNIAVDRYCAKGNFRRAASHKENLGELYEVELGDAKSAIECYELAATWYEGDNAAALANKLWLKVADVAAIEGDYYKAIEKYERVAEQSINNNLMKYSVKDYLLKAGICHLASGDLVAAQRALEKYRDMDPSFGAQREHQLLTDLCEAIEAKSQEQFTDRLYQFDQISKLDKWKTTILVRVKNQIEEEEDEEFA
ncbi:soluble NSF attachment protein [Fusarium oxysporum f. sp. albedinis]|uniref:Vesicular-fusion protein sec17 n=2 Tax=Fusarium TaxID=5506 RepID=F9G3V0_FUSOF|nr:hypothetical protein FOXB_13332 [Fusarium oxysporum f. sp. conglutinans Fo5176]KAI3588386.1 soluble NSF attachment protein [Fusarium oxysporum f. sp. albedinis]